MQSFRDFVVGYNNLDVERFVDAIKKMMEFWEEWSINMLKDGASVPGLMMKYLFNMLDEETYFSLFTTKNQDLYNLFKDNNTGTLVSRSFFTLI